ncbi:MAG TPA: hypothetical protein VHP35_00625 [Terriglobia bacterium]|nr:hypothetical protein [Terriglobia bacterium]
MRRSCKVWLSLSVTLSLAGLIQPMLVAKPGEKSQVTICVYDHSGLKAGTLAQAEKEADWIFRQAGVETEWRDLPTSEAEAFGKTNVLKHLGPTGFVLRILPKSMTEHLQIRDAVLGHSIPCPEDGSACIANILYHRVQDLAQSENVSLSQTLGREDGLAERPTARGKALTEATRATKAALFKPRSHRPCLKEPDWPLPDFIVI